MSRALARLRETTGDPLLVRAGRGLVPTPRALELRERVPQLVQDAEAILRPAEEPDLSALVRTFTLRTSEGFVENFGPELIARVGAEAPRVRLRFVPKPDKEAAPLRAGTVDLETGVVEPTTGPELRAQALFRDRLVGVVRAGHPLARAEVDARPLPRRPPHRRLARRARAVADRRRPGGARPGARHRHGRRRLRDRRRPRPQLGPDRHRPRAPHGEAARRHAQLRRSGRDAGLHRVAALAPAPRRRPGASLAPRPRPRRLRGGRRRGIYRWPVQGPVIAKT